MATVGVKGLSQHLNKKMNEKLKIKISTKVKSGSVIWLYLMLNLSLDNSENNRLFHGKAVGSVGVITAM